MTGQPDRWTWKPVRVDGRCQVAIFVDAELHALLHPHRLDEAWALCRRRNARPRAAVLFNPYDVQFSLAEDRRRT